MKKSFLITSILLLGLFISSSYAVEVTLLGPQKYLQTKGKPSVYTDNFPGRTGGGILKVMNGDANGKNRISSAVILINGVEILGPNDFNQNAYNLEVPISLEENNTISVELRSKPGSYLWVQVNQEFEADGAGIIGPEGGTVEVTDSSSLYYGVKMEVPPGALNQATILSINEPSFYPPIPEGFNTGDNPIELQPTGLVLNEPIKIIIPSSGLSERIFYVYDSDEEIWHFLDTSLNSNTNNFEIKINHFSMINWLCRYISGMVNCTSFQPCTTVTYSIDATTNNAPGYSEEQIKNAIRSAITKWEDTLDGRLYFREVESEESNIKFFWSAKAFPFVVLDAILEGETLAYCGVNLAGPQLNQASNLTRPGFI